jgi:hypothetical protein
MTFFPSLTPVRKVFGWNCRAAVLFMKKLDWPNYTKTVAA